MEKVETLPRAQCEASFLFLYSCEDLVHNGSVLVRQFLELWHLRISDPSAMLDRYQQGKRKPTYLFQFHRVLPKISFLHARLVVLAKLDASVLGFSLSGRL